MDIDMVVYNLATAKKAAANEPPDSGRCKAKLHPNISQNQERRGIHGKA